MATPGLITGIAEWLQSAIGAARLAGDANLAAVVDHLVGKGDPVVLRDDLHQVLLYRDWLRRLGQLEAS